MTQSGGCRFSVSISFSTQTPFRHNPGANSTTQGGCASAMQRILTGYSSASSPRASCGCDRLSWVSQCCLRRTTSARPARPQTGSVCPRASPCGASSGLQVISSQEPCASTCGQACSSPRPQVLPSSLCTGTTSASPSPSFDPRAWLCPARCWLQ